MCILTMGEKANRIDDYYYSTGEFFCSKVSLFAMFYFVVVVIYLLYIAN